MSSKNSNKNELMKKFESNNITKNEINLNKLLTILAESSTEDDFTNLKKIITKVPKSTTGKRKLSLDVLVAAYYFNRDKDMKCLQYLLCNDNIYFTSVDNIDKDKLVEYIILFKQNEYNETYQKGLFNQKFLENFKNRKNLKVSDMQGIINTAYNNYNELNNLNNSKCKKYCAVKKNCKL